MAQLGNSIINGALRVVGNIYGSMATPFCVCTTAGSTAAKTVTCPGFSLVDGARIVVCFQYYFDTSSSPTLNVNGTGAKPMSCSNNYIEGGYAVVEFIYSSSDDKYYQIGFTGNQSI